MLTFTAPVALALLIVLPALYLLGRERLQRLPVHRARLAMTLRLAIFALLIAALAGPQWQEQEKSLSVVFLLDASASVGKDGEKAGLEWATQAVAAAGADDQSALVLFGAAPSLKVPLAHYNSLPDPLSDPSGETDIAAALRLGLALLPPSTVGRMVLLSDGAATTGSTSDALAVALTRGVAVDTVALTPPQHLDVSVRSLTVPSRARIGDSIPVHFTLHSTHATNATLTLWIDGAAAQQTVALPAGDTVFGVEQRLTKVGVHTFRVMISAPGDSMPQNNALDAATVAAPQGHLLLAVSDPVAATSLARSLAQNQINVTPILATNLPQHLSGYHGIDAVLLDNVPASAMTAGQQSTLRDAVFSSGMGLLTVGGTVSFSAGNYSHTPLEDALPVMSIGTPRQVSAPLALMLVLDKSGSMSDAVAGVAKVDMVKVAAKSALDRLNIGDSVGVLAFDDTNHWIVPFHSLQGADDKQHIRQQIDTLTGDGDTYIYPALQEAERAVLRVPTLYRHIVLLTDGQGEDADFDTLIKRMHREHITLSTIGVGSDVQQDELHHWATLGGGLYHFVADPHDIPRIIINEARYGADAASHVHGTIRLGVASASPLLRDLAGKTLPTIAGYNSTLPKSGAQIAVQSASGDPVLSSWQYGLGRSVAWTSDTGTEWASKWSPQAQPTFWSDLVRWVMRAAAPSQPLPTLSAQNGLLTISTEMVGSNGHFNDTASPRVRIVDPTGAAHVVSLALTGPGQYSGSLLLAGSGIYTAAFTRNDQHAQLASDTATLAVPYSAEYAATGIDTAALTHIAETTGGQMLSAPASAFNHDGVPTTTSWLALWPWLLGLALLLFPLDVAARLLVPPDARYRATP